MRTLIHKISAAAAVCLFTSCAADKAIKAPVEHRYPARSVTFRQSLANLLGPNFMHGNRIATLVNGDEIFPAMLTAIRGAGRSVTFETYIYEDGEIARRFAQAFAERAKAGVKVHVILDAHGASKAGRANIALMEKAGVQVEKYHTLFWWDFRRYNNRTHRKLLVVDGQIGFIGGVGIADEWLGNSETPEHWRETHYRVEGPSVANLQAIFNENWIDERSEILHGPDYFPPLTAQGPHSASAFGSAPEEEDFDIYLMYLLAIAAAEKNIHITNPYFVPDDLLMKELSAAARRGVRVQIIVPGRHIDQKLVRHASRNRWKELLRAGVEIYEYQPTMIHAKLLVVDDLFVSVGSGNFDSRSIRLNDEANLNVMDRAFAAEQVRLFNRDLSKSARAIYDEQAGEIVLQSPARIGAGLLAPQL
jgi:cardiolipin synthase A/B